MSSKPAAIPLFADAYLADTMHLSTEEHGAYLLMLMAAWRYDDCSLPSDDKKLARVAGLSPRRWGQIKDTILEFWALDGDRIYNARLRKERGYVLQKSESNRENARKRWDAQGTENKQSGSSERISDGNAPPPPPIEEEEPYGSPSTPIAPKAKRAASAKFAIPADWTPGPLSADVSELVAQWPPGRMEREIPDFRDYWIENGAKRPGWDRTFHSRLRMIHDRVLREARNDRPNQPPRNNRSSDEPLNPFVRAAAERQAERAAGGAGQSGGWPDHGDGFEGMAGYPPD